MSSRRSGSRWLSCFRSLFLPVRRGGAQPADRRARRSGLSRVPASRLPYIGNRRLADLKTSLNPSRGLAPISGYIGSQTETSDMSIVRRRDRAGLRRDGSGTRAIERVLTFWSRRGVCQLLNARSR